MNDLKVVRLLEHVSKRQPHAYVPHLQRAFLRDALQRRKWAVQPFTKLEEWVRSRLDVYTAIRLTEMQGLLTERPETEDEYKTRLAETERVTILTGQRRVYYFLTDDGRKELEKTLKTTSH